MAGAGPGRGRERGVGTRPLGPMIYQVWCWFLNYDEVQYIDIPQYSEKVRSSLFSLLKVLSCVFSLDIDIDVKKVNLSRPSQYLAVIQII